MTVLVTYVAMLVLTVQKTHYLPHARIVAVRRKKQHRDWGRESWREKSQDHMGEDKKGKRCDARKGASHKLAYRS